MLGWCINTSWHTPSSCRAEFQVWRKHINYRLVHEYKIVCNFLLCLLFHICTRMTSISHGYVSFIYILHTLNICTFAKIFSWCLPTPADSADRFLSESTNVCCGLLPLPPAEFSSPVSAPPPICIGLRSNWGHCAASPPHLSRDPGCEAALRGGRTQTSQPPTLSSPPDTCKIGHFPPKTPPTTCLSLSLLLKTKPNVLTRGSSATVLRSWHWATHRIHGDRNSVNSPLSQCPSLLAPLVLVSLRDDPLTGSTSKALLLLVKEWTGGKIHFFTTYFDILPFSDTCILQKYTQQRKDLLEEYLQRGWVELAASLTCSSGCVLPACPLTYFCLYSSTAGPPHSPVYWGQVLACPSHRRPPTASLNPSLPIASQVSTAQMEVQPFFWLFRGFTHSLMLVSIHLGHSAWAL